MDENIKYDIIYSKIKNVYIQIKNGRVIVKAPRGIDVEELDVIVKKKCKWIQDSLQKFEQKKCRKALYSDEEFCNIVNGFVNELVEKMELYPNKVRIRDIKYAWGTCSKNKNITINCELRKYEKEVIKYVVLHELCHLKYMNHSKEFWGLVEMYMNNYKQIRSILKK